MTIRYGIPALTLSITLLLGTLVSHRVAAHEADPQLLIFAEVGETLSFDITDCCGCQATINAFSNDVGVCAVNAPQNGVGVSVTFTVTATGVGSTTITAFFEGFGTGDFDQECNEDSFRTIEVQVLEKEESTENTPESATVSDPINSFAGEFYTDDPPDINLGGPIPVMFHRYYGSRLYAEGLGERSLGQGWRHNFDFEIERGDIFDPDRHILIVTDKGRRLLFREDNGDWNLERNADIPYQLVKDGSEFLFGDPIRQLIYRFDTNSRLTEIFDLNGNTLSLSYQFQSSQYRLTQVSDGLGRSLTFTYDGNENLSTVSDGTRTLNYSVSGNKLDTYTDARTNTTTYTYDTTKPAYGALLTTITRPETNEPFENAYRTDGRIQSQTDASNNMWSFNYTATTGQVTDPLGNTFTHFYDSDGQLTQRNGESPRNIDYTYDANGRLSELDGSGLDMPLDYGFEYHAPSGNISKLIDDDGSETIFTYEGRTHDGIPPEGITFYYPTLIENPHVPNDSFTYDSRGNLLTQTNRLGDTYAYTYDGMGNVLTATLPTTGVYTFIYNADGTMASMEDPRGNLTEFDYDSLRRLTTVTHADTTTITYTYDNNNNILTTTNEGSKTTTFTYDGNNNLDTVLDPRGNTTTFAYDDLDRIVTVTDPDSGVTARSYDPLGRVESITDRNGKSRSVTFDPDTGVSLTRSDALNNTWTRTMTSNGFLESITDPLNNTWNFQTNYLGQVTQATTPTGAVWQQTFDNFNRLDFSTDPIGNITDFDYDAEWRLNMIAHTGSGVKTTYDRDELGNVTAIVDSKSAEWKMGRNLMGLRTSSTDPKNQTTLYSRNNRNRTSFVTYPDAMGTQTITYWPTGEVKRRLFSDGTDLNYTYDNMGALTSANNISLTPDNQGEIVASNGLAIGRDSAGRVITINHGGGRIVTYGYDGRNMPTTVTDWVNGVTTLTWDSMARLTEVARPNGTTTTYDYDDAGNVTGITHSRGVTDLGSIDLTRDHRGNVTSANRDLPLDPLATDDWDQYSYDIANQITDFEYDALGRRVADVDRTYTWDLASRLTSHSEGSGVSYTYDAVGKMVSRTEGGVTESYTWNYGFPMPVISTIAEEGTNKAYYIYSPFGQLLHRINHADNSRRYYHFDEVGNTVFITDGAGNMRDQFAVSPYGRILNAASVQTDQPFIYRGQEGVMRDGETDLYYMRARFYDADSARFISRDPLNQSVSPLETNPYSFARANPMMYSDPTGFNAKVIWDGGIHTDIAVEVWCGDELLGVLKLGFFSTEYLRNQMGGRWTSGVLGVGVPSTIKGNFSYGASLGPANRGATDIVIGGSREQDERLTRQMLEWMGYDSFGNAFSAGDIIKALFPKPKGKSSHTANIWVNSTKSYGAYRVGFFSRVCNDFTNDSLDVYYGTDWSSWGPTGNRSAQTLFNELNIYENGRTSTHQNWMSYGGNGQ